MLFAPVPLVLFAVMLHGDQIIWQGIELWDWNAQRLLCCFRLTQPRYLVTGCGINCWSISVKHDRTTVNLACAIFALISGYFMYDEVLSVAQVVASVLFLVGIGLIVKPAGSGTAKLVGKISKAVVNMCLMANTHRGHRITVQFKYKGPQLRGLIKIVV